MAHDCDCAGDCCVACTQGLERHFAFVRVFGVCTMAPKKRASQKQTEAPTVVVPDAGVSRLLFGACVPLMSSLLAAACNPGWGFCSSGTGQEDRQFYELGLPGLVRGAAAPDPSEIAPGRQYIHVSAIPQSCHDLHPCLAKGVFGSGWAIYTASEHLCPFCGNPYGRSCYGYWGCKRELFFGFSGSRDSYVGLS